MANFSIVLSSLRKKAGLSQLELGEKLGLSKSTISMYESGQRKPSFEVLEAIADYFNVNMGTLTGQSPTPSITPEDLELLELFHAAPPEKQAAIRALLK